MTEPGSRRAALEAWLEHVEEVLREAQGPRPDAAEDDVAPGCEAA